MAFELAMRYHDTTRSRHDLIRVAAFQDFAGLSQVFEVDEQCAIGQPTMVTMWSLAIGECANHKQRLSQVVEAVGIENIGFRVELGIGAQAYGLVDRVTVGRPLKSSLGRFRCQFISSRQKGWVAPRPFASFVSGLLE
jgi:hypothetical protein